MNAVLKLTRVVIGVCTRDRPKMLLRCLTSINAQEFASEIIPELVVVDNSEGGTARSVFDWFKPRAKFKVTYIACPIPSIARARNCVVKYVRINPSLDWVAFIDDDAEAAPGWLAGLLDKRYDHAPVLVGRVDHYLEDQAKIPFWTPDNLVKKYRSLKGEGEKISTGRTGNVRFTTSLIKEGLAFDVKLGLGGGEDQLFFRQGQKLGYDIFYTHRAIVREAVHPSRMTFSYQIYRHYSHVASVARMRILEDNKPVLGIGLAITSLKALVLGPSELILSVVVFPFSRKQFKRFAMRGAKRFATVAGTVAALHGHLPQPYRKVHGK